MDPLHLSSLKKTARILSAWLLVDADVLTANQVHRLIGTWYNYPKCCVEFFIKHYDNEGLTWVCMVDSDTLGTYVQCHDCWTDENIWLDLKHLAS